MKKAVFAALILAAGTMAHGQTCVGPGCPSIVTVQSTPPSCGSVLPFSYVASTNALYGGDGTGSCQQVNTGGSGTFNALTGDATSTATGGATTVKGINGVVLSTLATGLYKFTAGVPSAAAAGTDYVIPSGSITGNAATATNMSTNGTANQVWGMNSGASAQGWQTVSSSGGQAIGNASVTFVGGAATYPGVGSVNVITVAPTANVTSASNPTGGVTNQIYVVHFVQPAGGGITNVWPSDFINPPTVALEAAATTDFQVRFDGTNYQYLTATNSSGHGIQVETSAPGSNPAAGLLFPWPSSADADLEVLNPAGVTLGMFNKAGDCNILTGICTTSNGVAIVTTTGSQTLTNKTLTSPTLTTPALGTPASGVLTNTTGLPLTSGVTGILPLANGGTATATPSLVAGTNVTITGTWPNQTVNSSGGGGGGGGAALNPSCTFASLATGCTINVASLTVATANVTSLIVQCATLTTGTYTNLVGTYTVTSSGGNLATVVTSFGAATAAGSCTANATSGGVNNFTGDSLIYSNSASTGNVTLALNTQAANTSLRGPASGSAAAPTFRADVIADLPVGTVYSVTPATGTSDTLTCSSTGGITTNPVAFATTISRPAFTQTAGAVWQLGISAISTSSASGLTFTFEVKDGSTVVYLSAPQTNTINTANLPLGAVMNEQISGSNLTSAALTVYPLGAVFSNFGQGARNLTAQVTGYNSNASATMSVLMECSAATAGNSVTLTGLTETRIY